MQMVQVVHTDPKELGMFKDYTNRISKGEEKHKTEVDLIWFFLLCFNVGTSLVFIIYLFWNSTVFIFN